MTIMGYFFLFLHKNLCCGYSLESPWRSESNEYPQHIFFLWRTDENYPLIISKYLPCNSSINPGDEVTALPAHPSFIKLLKLIFLQYHLRNNASNFASN